MLLQAAVPFHVAAQNAQTIAATYTSKSRIIHSCVVRVRAPLVFSAVVENEFTKQPHIIPNA